MDLAEQLTQAAWEGDAGLVVRLLGAGADPNATNREHRTAVDLAVQAGHAEVVRVLVAAGAALDGPAGPYHELNLMCLAAMFGCTEVVDVLLDVGVPVGERNRSGLVPVVVAAGCGHRETVALLLDRGADVDDRRMRNGTTPLGVAAWSGHLEVVRLLLDRGAQPTASALASARRALGHRPADRERYELVIDLLTLTPGTSD
ncbi:ankyrin repeat domain-containing protein [Streptomyces sp. NPDC001858]